MRKGGGGGAGAGGELREKYETELRERERERWGWGGGGEGQSEEPIGALGGSGRKIAGFCCALARPVEHRPPGLSGDELIGPTRGC